MITSFFFSMHLNQKILQGWLSGRKGFTEGGIFVTRGSALLSPSQKATILQRKGSNIRKQEAVQGAQCGHFISQIFLHMLANELNKIEALLLKNS